ncbi:MAG: HAD family phosphatase [Chloracidobacterium sp.]|nr:HAD family phosphatase [Chloracidobacterium sp.]
MNSKKAIVFDLGGVLIDWNPRYLYRKLFNGDEEAMERFLSEICTPEWNARQDEGRTFAAATEELIALHPEQAGLIRAFFDRWPEMVAGAIEPTVGILSELKGSGRALYALSNWSMETFPHARERFEFLGWFDRTVISGEIGLIKPNREVFDFLLVETGRHAEECAFIDDSPANVAAARELGFDAIHYRSPRRLRDELINRGILP